jgi:GNAT superfamily N-acetyltransferase
VADSGPPAAASAAAAPHPRHDAIARAVRGWYTEAVPEVGIVSSEHWFGSLCLTGPDRARVVLTIDEPDQVPRALAAARAAAGAERGLLVMVDDHDRAGRLDVALRSGGCQFDEVTTYLALAGLLRAEPGPAGLAIENAETEADLAVWATVRLQSFADSEAAPSAASLADEVASRVAELPLASYQTGRLDGEAVSALAYYPGADQLVFILGTRLPYRHAGIAQAMLGHWARAAAADGCRSLIINAHEGGRPAELYRRMGFTDEIYWYRKYDYCPPA